MLPEHRQLSRCLFLAPIVVCRECCGWFSPYVKGLLQPPSLRQAVVLTVAVIGRDANFFFASANWGGLASVDGPSASVLGVRDQ